MRQVTYWTDALVLPLSLISPNTLSTYCSMAGSDSPRCTVEDFGKGDNVARTVVADCLASLLEQCANLFGFGPSTGIAITQDISIIAEYAHAEEGFQDGLMNLLRHVPTHGQLNRFSHIVPKLSICLSFIFGELHFTLTVVGGRQRQDCSISSKADRPKQKTKVGKVRILPSLG